MTYDEWLTTIPESLTLDPLWRMEVYRLALFCQHLSWVDVQTLAKRRETRSLSDQLYRAVGSIGANIAEGYSRSSQRDQVRFYEYALGSAREARHWYMGIQSILSSDTYDHRITLLTSIIRLLLKITRTYHSVREEEGDYSTSSDTT